MLDLHGRNLIGIEFLVFQDAVESLRVLKIFTDLGKQEDILIQLLLLDFRKRRLNVVVALIETFDLVGTQQADTLVLLGEEDVRAFHRDKLRVVYPTLKLRTLTRTDKHFFGLGVKVEREKEFRERATVVKIV